MVLFVYDPSQKESGRFFSLNASLSCIDPICHKKDVHSMKCLRGFTTASKSGVGYEQKNAKAADGPGLAN